MARVIRSQGKLIAGEVVDASLRAKDIVEQAQQEADSLLAEARTQAEKIETEAKKLGEAKGHATAAATLAMAADAQANAIKGAENTIVSLAIVAAKRIVGEMAEQNPGHIREVVSGLLKRTERATRITVTVHPKDAPLLKKLATDGIEFNTETDKALARGECFVQTDLGDLDARFDVQLDTLKRALLDGKP